MNVLEFELNEVRERYDRAFEKLKGLVEWNKGEFKELIYKILTSPFLSSVVGGWDVGVEYGYMGQLNRTCESPLIRMEFTAHFVSYDILDDGEPGIGWLKYSSSLGKCVRCKPNEKNAHPFLARCNEEWDNKRLGIEEALWIFNWYEKEEEERIEFNKKYGIKDSEIIITEQDTAIDELVKELGYA